MPNRAKITVAPLPFTGQKRRFVAPLRELFRDLPESTVFVDVFGGSGLLARLCKDLHPAARVVYNDYDNFAERLAHIANTESLRVKLSPFCKAGGKPSHCSHEETMAIADIVEKHLADTGYVDWVSLSSWLLFTFHRADSVAELRRGRIYGDVPKMALSGEKAKRYLDGLEVVHMDWSEAIARHRNDPNALFILDPPYLGSYLGGYQGASWGIDDYADLLGSIPDSKYVYFTSGKFDFVPILQRLVPENVFTGALRYEYSSPCVWTSLNNEVMYYKLQ